MVVAQGMLQVHHDTQQKIDEELKLAEEMVDRLRQRKVSDEMAMIEIEQWMKEHMFMAEVMAEVIE